ncbi:MAG: hypothetical protein ACLRSG_07190 [Christensenellales bacterium]
MNGIMITLIIVFVFDLIGCFITARMEVKREIMTERQLQKIEELLLSSSHVSPFPEYEVHRNDENGRKETEK